MKPGKTARCGHATNFASGLGGEFLEIRTFAKNENDEIIRRRYFTIFAYDKASDKVQSYGVSRMTAQQRLSKT